MRASAAIRACLRGHDPSDEQWAAITHPPEPVAIIAGAGSGKTAIMAARMVWMVEEDLHRPSQILGLTFTNKAAQELEERILLAFDAMDPAPPESPVVATYNSFADRLVREHGVRIGIDPDVGLLSQAQSWQLLLEAFGSIPPFDAIDSRSMASVIRSALALAESCGNHLVTPERLIQEDERLIHEAGSFDPEVVLTSRKRIELAGVVSAYIEAKRKAGRIDFSDQVTQAVEILTTFPEVAQGLRERYPALLLDEYQDTNVAQRKLLQQIAPSGHNVTAVGDARQNIFQWRGSTLFNLIDFPAKHFLRSGEKTHEYLSLSRNYRSGERILSVANHLIEPVPSDRRPGKPLDPHPANGTGRVVAKVLSDQYAEAEFIASEIAKLHGGPADEGRPATAWSDFAILVRRRAHIGPIYQSLKARDIPVEVVGLTGLLQVPEVLDTVAWLRVLADPGPNSNRWLARILLGPRFRIHYRDLALLARWAAEHNIELSKDKQETAAGAEDAMVPDETGLDPDQVAYSLTEALDHLDEVPDLPPEAKRRLAGFRRELDQLRPRRSDSLLELVQAVIAGAGIIEAIDASSREDAASAKANLTNFLGIVGGFAPVSGEPSINGFLAYLDAAEDVEETLDMATPAAGDSVKLMTVHQAKGLEFEVVFLPCIAASTNEAGEHKHSFFPDIRTSNPMRSFSQLPHGVREDAEHLPNPWTPGKDGALVPKKKAHFTKELVERAIEDERRLFYVAITRAKQRAYVTAAWWYERQSSMRGPSLFFEEVSDAAGVERLPDDDAPEVNPLEEILLQRSAWPPPGTSLQPDDLFPETYPKLVEMLLDGDLRQEAILERLAEPEREEALEALGTYRRTLRSLLDAGELAVPEPRPRTLSATSLVSARRDAAPGDGPATSGPAVADGGSVPPRGSAWRPVPERPSEARRIGTEVHRWIEELARGLTGLADEDALDAPSGHVSPERIDRLRANFVEMGYASKTLARLDTGEPMSEVPFMLKVGGTLIRGRIDAVYEGEDGSLEIVDFKTGERADVPTIDQLTVYAIALSKLGLEMSRPVRLTYAYLDTQEEVTRELPAADLDAAFAELSRRLAPALQASTSA